MPAFDLVIRNGTVIDGTRTKRFKADVAISNGRIAQVGKIRKSSSREELDATGTILGSDLRFFFHYVEEFNPSTGIHTFRGARINIG